MKVVKDSSGDAVIYPFLPQTASDEETFFKAQISVAGDQIRISVSTQGDFTIEQVAQLNKALQEAISIAQVNRHQAQLSADAKAVQE